MHRPAIRLATLLALAALATGDAAEVRAAGDEYPGWAGTIASHELRGPQGTALRIGDLKGDVVVVNFWASWCKPCRKELRVLGDWVGDLAGDPARIVTVSIDGDRRRAERFLEDEGLPFPLYHDGPDGLARALDLPSLPCTVVLDADGRLVRVVRDGSAEGLDELRGTVRDLIADRVGELTAADEDASG
ncbi:MAG TPA: TlpA disulfide reductase family protein [bacterium]|nr:TlpA disulfide reductase family protein [bacterium]